ncbi:MAG: dihydroneopterin aldolase [Epsilonproteobacteria bacterium]|nr:dihydroneopterin aldolase [Campylobacterota bacterium]
MRVIIQDLKLDVMIGILDFERDMRQRVVVDMELDYNYTGDSFINYIDVISTIEGLLSTRGYQLLEDALLEIGETILSDYPETLSLNLKISKPDIVQNGIVSVSKLWN